MAKRRHLRRRRPQPVVRIGDAATPERRRQLGGVVSEVVDRDVTGRAYIKRDRARIECMLDRYFDKYSINDPQLMAGLKYRELSYGSVGEHFQKVLCQPFLIDASKADPAGKMIARMDAARQLWEVERLLTKAEKRVMRDVCCYDKPVFTTRNKQILLCALDKLALHWWNYPPETKDKKV